MKYKIEPTHQERVMREGDFIVSVRQIPKGVSLIAIGFFVEFSGFQEAELLGEQHNIVRHPDMPRGVFRFLWDSVLQKKECFAFVKNMCKDGSFYWVFANVTPDLDASGQLAGCFSVRRKPSTKAVAVMTDIYNVMLEEREAGRSQRCL